jgi:DNA-binding transcriptional ArsR family regulator
VKTKTNNQLISASTEKELERKADFFGALSSSKRLMILLFLHRKESSNVTTIQEELNLRQSLVSQHLRILLHAGFVRRKRIGTTALYKLTPSGKEVVKLIEERDGRF